MAWSNEDHKDVKHHMGKALANKVADATRDHSGKLRKNDAKKSLYDMGVKNKGKEETIKGMKKAFGSRETNKAKSESYYGKGTFGKKIEDL